MIHVPPPLYIKLGIVNKIIESLVSAVRALSHKYDGEHEGNTVLNAHISYCLTNVGARREDYYEGKLAGPHCNNLMKNRSTFCNKFFNESISVYPPIEEALHQAGELRLRLISVADIYNDFEFSSRRGLGFYIGYQGKWSSTMAIEWSSTCFSFVRRLEAAIWRPRKGREQFVEVGKVPLQIPKLHSLLIHVEDFVRLIGYWAFFSEEYF